MISGEELSLSAPILEKVSGDSPSYRQFLRHQGKKVIIPTENFSAASLNIRTDNKRRSVMIPTDGPFRAQLDVIETFVTKNVIIPPGVVRSPDCKVPIYKAQWPQNNMFVTLAPWCKFFKHDSQTNSYVVMDPQGPFGNGTYHMMVEVSHIYIGPHKEGQLFSLSLHVVQVVYQPEIVSTDVDSLFATLQAEQKSAKTRKSKVKKTDTVSKPTLVPSFL